MNEHSVFNFSIFNDVANYFFMSLPFGLSVPEEQQIGNANSAPDKPNLRLKFFISFLIAFVPTLLIYWLIEKNIFFELIINS